MRISDWSSDVCSSDLCEVEGKRPVKQDIHEYLAELDDIPGTRVFTAKRARQGYWLNQMCMTLMKPENRAAFKGDERAYLDRFQMTEAQKEAVLKRDYNAALDEGGNIYFLAKVFFTDRSEENTSELQSLMRKSYA